ncbi:MAG: DegT/DnrJ/EryC1/StrS aminotransferase family protein, partial [Candidatus Accumulibacter sp.]|nr:DegT/DnrJ/EryC1/StrS aminotransferase family protein [Accumulibacter sp.]
FPLVIERPDPDFFRLKRAGLPIWRWDERAVAPGAPDCGVARHYQLHLLHLPCHQGLDAARMDWMIAVAGSVLEENTG